MASYKVAVLGSVRSRGEVFDLGVDQICSLLEKPDVNKGVDHAKLGAQPALTFAVQGGGRFSPYISREEVTRAMQGVEVLIVMLPVVSPNYRYYNFDFTTIDFFTYLTEDNLLDQCSTVIVRIVDNSTGTIRRSRRSRTNFDMNSTLKTYRLDSDKFKDKLRIIADSSVKFKKQKKGDKSEGVSQDLAQLRAALSGEELRERVTQPVKETLSAGKSLLDAGQRFSRWISGLIKSA